MGFSVGVQNLLLHIIWRFGSQMKMKKKKSFAYVQTHLKLYML